MIIIGILIIIAFVLVGFYYKGKIEDRLILKEVMKTVPIEEREKDKIMDDAEGKFIFAFIVFSLLAIIIFVHTESLVWLIGSGSVIGIVVNFVWRRKVKETLILSGILLFSLSIFGAYSWWVSQQVYRENVVYVTTRPIYHHMFHIDEFGEDFQVRVVDDYAVVRNRESGAFLVIDMTTGRELMNFQPLENRRHRRTYDVALVGDGTVRVSRNIFEVGTARQVSHQMSLLDIATGEELYSFESTIIGHRIATELDIVAVHDGLAIVGRPWLLSMSIENGVIELESGEITVPNIYCEMVFIYDQLVRVGVEEDRVRRYGIIDGVTGEEIRPIMYERIVESREAGCGLISLRDENQTTLIDFATGEEVIDLSQFELDYMDIRGHGYGLFVLSGVTPQGVRESALIEIESAREIIPMGTFQHIRILNEHTVMASEYDFWTDGDSRPMVINIHTGEAIIPRGRYEYLNRAIYYGGLLLVSDEDRQAIVSVTTGEYIVPFGTYDRIGQLLPGGYITVRVGDYWKILNVTF